MPALWGEQVRGPLSKASLKEKRDHIWKIAKAKKAGGKAQERVPSLQIWGPEFKL
jgi:hypothetical protein